jgi:hypothetical protein
MSKIYKMVIEDDSHAGLRSDYNNVLRDTLNKMSEKGILKTTINLKIKIKMLESVGEDNKPVYNPQFSHKIKTVFQEITEAEGSFTPEDASMRWNNEDKHFEVIQRQANLFEHDDDQDEEPEEDNEPVNTCKTCAYSTKTGKQGRSKTCKSCINNPAAPGSAWNRWVNKIDSDKKSADEVDNKSIKK